MSTATLAAPLITVPGFAARAPDATPAVDAGQIAAFRRDGFVCTPSLLTLDETASLRERFLATAATSGSDINAYGGAKAGAVKAFDQYVNLWQAEPSLLDLAMHPRMRATATALAGEPLRLWHDHLLVKRAGKSTPTEFHQDQPYWPHQDGDGSLSAWVALVDVPAERGCMSYIPGSQHLRDLPAQNLNDAMSLMTIAPELRWQPTVSIPVKAGSVVWHHARTAHRANQNVSDQDRVVVSVIYMPRTTRFTGKGHICTKDLGLKPGDLIAGPGFPEV